MTVFSSGQAAKKLGIPFYTLDYLERVGKIPKAKRVGETGQKYYTDEDLEKIRLIVEDIEYSKVPKYLFQGRHY